MSEHDRPLTVAALKAAKERQAILKAEPWKAEGLTPPPVEDLMEWDEEGGCMAACKAECWVEPDGWCEHGRPSWLLALGMI